MDLDCRTCIGLLAFFEGTPTYDFVNLAVGVVGLGLTVAAIAKAALAARAAGAAKVAARIAEAEAGSAKIAAGGAQAEAASARAEVIAAKRLIRGISAGVELSDLRGYLREAIARMEAGSHDAALQCLVIVREQMARVSRLPIGSRLAPAHWWRDADRELADFTDGLRQRRTVEPQLRPPEVAQLVGKLIDLSAALATMQATAESDAAADQ